MLPTFGVIPKAPRFHQRGEESPTNRWKCSLLLASFRRPRAFTSGARNLPRTDPLTVGNALYLWRHSEGPALSPAGRGISTNRRKCSLPLASFRRPRAFISGARNLPLTDPIGGNHP